MNRSTLRYNILCALAFLVLPSFVSADAGEDLGGRRALADVEPVGEKTQPSSLSGKISLPTLDPNPTAPEVVLSEKHKASCLKQVGDPLDPITVKDVSGRDVKLQEELSDRFTVLIFWSEESVSGYEQFRRIPVDLLAKFAPHRVKVVAANVGGAVQETQRLTGAAADKLLSLADTDSTLFKQFASSGVSRTYVLDADGRVVWFDMEYSESTRRSLDNALCYFIQQTSEKSP